MSWTDERVDRLKTLWLDGHSASAVARQLGGVTRNAVIGKVHRLGLSGRAQPSAPTRLKPAPRQPVSHPRRPALAVLTPASAPASAPFAPRPPEAPAPRTPLLRLSACGCRFGLGDPRDDDFGFCDAPRVRGSYCAAHAEIAYQATTPARVKSDVRWPASARRTG